MIELFYSLAWFDGGSVKQIIGSGSTAILDLRLYYQLLKTEAKHCFENYFDNISKKFITVTKGTTLFSKSVKVNFILIIKVFVFSWQIYFEVEKYAGVDRPRNKQFYTKNNITQQSIALEELNGATTYVIRVSGETKAGEGKKSLDKAKLETKLSSTFFLYIS